MPDWSYRTLLRPLLFALLAERARDLTVGMSAALAGVPGGARFIEAFGDLTPPPELATTLAGVRLRSPVGLGVGIDVAGRAARAWERLGFGFLEVGHVTMEPVVDSAVADRDVPSQGLLVPDLPVNPGVDAVAATLAGARPLHAPLVIRVACAPAAGAQAAAAEQREVAHQLRAFASIFTLDWTRKLVRTPWGAREWSAYLRTLAPRARAVWGGEAGLRSDPARRGAGRARGAPPNGRSPPASEA